MVEAMFYEKLKDSLVRCTLCPRYCVIKPEERGYCGTRLNKDGILYAVSYGVVSSIANDPVEKKPLFHFYPGSM
ncbi:MAG TPA: radical SAM protein, partial [bacterium]|nr:radical SAM protein [bacterium]